MDRLGDEIAELSAHLEAATARLLDLIREFDARGGWSHGFRSCAHWLARCARAGWESASTWAGPSTSCTPGPFSPWRSASRAMAGKAPAMELEFESCSRGDDDAGCAGTR